MTDPSTGDRAGASGVLPGHSVLSLDEYLAMQAALGDRLRFRAVRALAAAERRPGDLVADLDVAANRFHYHLDVLVDVGLVERRKRKPSGSQQLHTTYRATAMAETLLTEGIETLLREEWELLEFYGG